MLTDKARKALEIALASSQASPASVAKEIADAIDSGSNPQAAAVAELGTTTDLTGVDGTGNNAADLATTEARLDAVEAKVDEVIAALKAAGLMAS
ncbi:MAG: hypothetical protein GWN01_15345 [Nitrosopumilaceae archaeon]|nr:hypothetical protein [Nitrosopumilaceae archaeon]NIU87501.1 hypothetical protein [Nitrosopumilaceae archaeon]NIX62818.1 hypothetical protein [Nitrosopumilaceae archaeon]